MQIYDEIHKLRDYCYDDYLSQLREKLEKQKVNIKKKSDILEKKFKMKEEKEVFLLSDLYIN